MKLKKTGLMLSLSYLLIVNFSCRHEEIITVVYQSHTVFQSFQVQVFQAYKTESGNILSCHP